MGLYLIQQPKTPQLALLVRHRITQRMGPASRQKRSSPTRFPGGPYAGDLEDARRVPQRRVRGHDLDARHPLGRLAALVRRHVPLLPVPLVRVRDLPSRAVGQCLGGAQVRRPGAIAREDGELVHGDGFVVAAEGPGSRAGRGVGGCVGERAESDAEVKVREDELDAGNELACDGMARGTLNVLLKWRVGAGGGKH